MKLSYLPETERVELEDLLLRKAGFHLLRTTYAGDPTVYWWYWCSRDGAVSFGPHRASRQLAEEDALEAHVASAVETFVQLVLLETP